MDEMKKIIDLQPLSDEEIRKNHKSLSELWMIKDEQDSILGPYETQQLKNYIANNEKLFIDSRIYNLEEEKWYKTFSLSHFQRRKQDLAAPTNTHEVTDFYLIINGQKKGPYSQDEVQNLLESGQITTTSELSLDKGKSWKKLYEHSHFDRRSKKSNQELPFQPAPEILEKVTKTKEEILRSKDSDEAIVELAFIGHKKNTKDIPSDNLHELNNYPAENTSNRPWKLMFIGFATVCIISFSSYKLFNGFQGSNSPQRHTDNKISINDSQRNIVEKKKRQPAKSQTKPRNLIKPKKITRSPKLRTRNAPERYRPERPPRKLEVPSASMRKQDIEEIDINNPEVQEELTRELAGDGDLEELTEQERFDDEEYENYPDDDSEYGMEGKEVHTSEDY